ncbi:MAG TPA: ATP-binding cassette domain-containing protein [Acidimicrobiales bacterium]|nr:ATP-binding cassette domain-containing protein [Acidimicrobiales bacterium]
MTTANESPEMPGAVLDVAEEAILRTEGITKRFGAVVALRGVDMHLRRGEVLGIVGDNGAGKSTFVKIVTGFQRQDSGKIFLEGSEANFHSVTDARRAGIETVYQDLALVPQLTVYENLFLNRELTGLGRFGWLSRSKMRRLADEYLHDIRVNVPDINAEVELLSGGQRQAIAVARATRQNAKILLLDEPLAAMGAKESTLIIDLVKDLSKNRGVSMIVIDHNYTHLFELCDRLNVIQQGRVTVDKKVAETSIEELTELMVAEYRRQVREGHASLGA